MPRFPRPGRLLRNESGAFDLPSVLIGVAVVAILAVGVMALVFGAVPWAQSRAAAQDLAALTTAQGTAKAKDGEYADPTRMAQLGYLSSDTALDFSLSADGSCWVGVAKAKSGKHFYTVNGSAPAELTRGTKPDCLGASPRYEKVIAGRSGACGLGAGTLYCWGDNAYGQLGGGTIDSAGRPVRAAAGELTGKTITDADSGGWHTCAIDAGGVLYCWGSNSYGKSGDGTLTVLPSPVSVRGHLQGKRVTSVSLTNQTSCAVAEEKLYCWGSGIGVPATLGDKARSAASKLPLLVDGGDLDGVAVKSVSVSFNHACALSTSGKAYCWGEPYPWQNGTNTSAGPNYAAVPKAVDMSKVDGGAFTDLNLGNQSACAIGSGKAYCWGFGREGQTGNGALAETKIPTPVGGTATAGKTLVQISAAGHTSCAMDDQGEWFCWGDNAYGQLSTGDSKPVLYPRPYEGAAVIGGKPNQLSLGEYNLCALKERAVFCAGSGDGATLGDGKSTSSRVPVEVAEPVNAKSWAETVLDGGRLS